MSPSSARLKVLNAVLEQENGDWLVAFMVVAGEPDGGDVLRSLSRADEAWQVISFSFVRTDAYIAGRRLLVVRPLGGHGPPSENDLVEAERARSDG